MQITFDRETDLCRAYPETLPADFDTWAPPQACGSARKVG